MNKVKKVQVNVSHIEDAVASFLIAMGAFNTKDIVSVTLPIKSKDGLVDVKVLINA